MRRIKRWAVAGLAACGCSGGERTAPSPFPPRPAPAPPPPLLHVKLDGCAPAQLAPRVSLSLGLVPPREASGQRAPAGTAADHVADAREWTPYSASEGLAPVDIAQQAADALAKIIPLDKVERCFGDHTGSLRSLTKIAFDGGVIAARSGGIGDHQVEACVASTLIGLSVAPPPIIAEVACDFSRGEPQPWRATTDAGYAVIEVTAHELRFRGKPIDANAPIEGVSKGTPFLLVADPDVPAKQLSSALTLAMDSPATLVAVRDGARPPRFVAMGLDGRTNGGSYDPPGARAVEIDIDDKGVRGCIAGQRVAGDNVDAVLAVMRSTCATTCASTLAVGIDGALAAGKLPAIVDAARAAGFAKLVLGTNGCS